MIWAFLALIPIYAFADCGTIKNGTTVSLMDAGNSLAQMKLQDQDGLTTCYANSLATVLQSALPAHPEISYTDLAFKKATYGYSATWREKRFTGTKSNPGSEHPEAINLTSYGDACIAFNAAKKAGGACAKERSLLENGTFSNPDLQEQMLRTLGTYFDMVNELRRDSAKFDAFKAQLTNMLPKIRAGVETLRQECEEEKSQEFPLRSAFKGLVSSAVWDYMDEPNDCSKAKAEAMKRYLDRRSYIDEKRSWLAPKDEAVAAFEAALLAAPGARELLQRMKAADPNSDVAYEELPRELEPLLAPLMEKFFPGWNTSCSSDPTREPRTLNDAAKSVYSSVSFAKRRPCDTQGLSDTLMILRNEWPTDEACWTRETQETISALIYPLSQLGRAIDDQLLKELLEPTNDYGEQLRRILTPSCLEAANNISLAKASCSTIATCAKWSYTSNNSTYTGAANGCHTLATAKSLFRTRILGELKAQRALSLGICTNFMSQLAPTKSGFCTRPQPNQTKNDFIHHMLTVTGYRCVGTKLEYQLVDSMGSSYCPLYDPKSNSAYSCVLDAAGGPTGVYWMSEDAMVDAATTISSVKVAP